MCGRFVQTTSAQKLAKQFESVSNLESFEPRYNIAPTATVAVVRISTKSANRVLESLKWGLVPHWAKDPSIGAGMGNARAETVADKPSFRDPFKSQRCLVPVDGFYEWQQSTKPKQPFYFTMKDKKPFALAALWDSWKPKAGAPAEWDSIISFTLITTTPNSIMEPVHDRMPVILDEENYDLWLNPNFRDTQILKHFLKPFPTEKMESEAVSTFVNSTKNQGSQCVEKLSD